MTLAEAIAKITKLRDTEAEAWDNEGDIVKRRYHEGRRDSLDNVLWILKECE